MKAIIMLFKIKEGATNSEKYYPNITGVNVTVEGVPNTIFSRGMKKHHFFKEAKRFFLNRKRDTMSITDFFIEKTLRWFFI